MGKFTKFARIAEIEFSNIVISCQDLSYKLRIYLKDKSFIDFFFSRKTKILRFSIHWERTHIDKTIYRLDNTPDKKWNKIKTFPVHFHYQKYESVKIPPFNTNKQNLENIFRDFLKFAAKKLTR
jgi:hypothetical protein